ncbi:ester cyclase [Oxalobacteraceae bacterium OTU3CINTB1]|nr:ester cyclase [Oxalobacteraceae bacterium OTU3CINTB1]
MNQLKSQSAVSLARRVMLASGAIAATGLLNIGRAATQPAAIPRPASAPEANIALEIYKALAADELDRWDAVVHPDVVANSPAGRNIVGLQNLKRWQKSFGLAFRPRIDLIDHFVAGDRGLVTINLHWKHDGGPFNGIAPTGKGGTSVESFMLRIENGMVVRWDIADHSLDLANYLHDQGMKMPTNVTPPTEIKG